MAEYINRDDTEKALFERCNETGYGGLTRDDVRLVMRTPWRIPSADVVERKRGEWKGKPIAGYYAVCCSCCGEAFLENSGQWNFCPNCGAEMRGENNV